MAVRLYDVLKNDIRKMVRTVGKDEKGNIYPLLISQIEKYLIELVLEETDNNYFHAARYLGISRSTLYRKIHSLLIAGRDGEKPVEKA